MIDHAAKKPLIKQGWLRVILFGCAFAVITLLIAIPAVLLIAGVKKEDLLNAPISTLAGQLKGNFLWLMLVLECAISLVSVWLFRVWVDRASMSSLGLSTDGFGSEALAGLLTGPALLGISAIVLLLTGHAQWTDVTPDASTLIISLGMMMMIAVGEELVFRGYILTNLLDSFSNKWVALAISAGLFALFHI